MSATSGVSKADALRACQAGWAARRRGRIRERKLPVAMWRKRLPPTYGGNLHGHGAGGTLNEGEHRSGGGIDSSTFAPAACELQASNFAWLESWEGFSCDLWSP